MGLSEPEREDLLRTWRPEFGAAEVRDLARRYGVSERTIWRLTRRVRSARRRRADARGDGEYLAWLGEDLVLWCLGQIEEGAALRDAIAAARDLGKPRAERLSAHALRRALASRAYGIARMRRRGRARPDGSRAPLVKRAVERVHPNSLHQYDETRAPSMFVDIETGEYVYESGLAIDWRERQPGRAPLWIACTIDDATRARHFVPIPTPSAEAVLAALGEAWLPKADPERMPFAGLPLQVYGDNGSWLSSETVRAALEALQVRASYHAPYHPEAKGKVERAFRATASLFVQERLSRSRVRLREGGTAQRLVLRMREGDLARFFVRLNLLANNRETRATGEAPYARWSRLMQAHPECYRPAPPAEVFAELALARVIVAVRPDVSVRLPGGERVGLDWQVFGEFVGREVEVRYRRLERGREPAEGETIALVADGRRFEAPRRAPVPERRLDAAERPVTPAERLSEAAARVDYAGEDLTRHAEVGAPRYAVPEAPAFDAARIARILGERLVRIGRLEAIERIQRSGVFSRPLSEEDKRRAAEWLAGEAFDLAYVDAIARTGRPPADGAAQAASAG